MKLIAIEGIDHSGKATQVKLLKEFLESKGFKVTVYDFPHYESVTGGIIQQWLYKKIDGDKYFFELMQTADKQLAQNYIQELDEQGFDFLLLDRYTTSQKAYAMASGLLEWTEELQRYMRKPDYEIFIDLPAEVSMSRKGKHGDNDRYESDKEFLDTVRHAYKTIFSTSTTYVRIINGELPIGVIQEKIQQSVSRYFDL